MRHLVELFLFFTVLMALPDWYIYRTYILRLKEQVWHRLYWLPSILLFICMLIAFIGYEPRPEAMNRLSLLLIVFLCINVPKALFALCALTLRALAGKIHHEFYESYIALAIAMFSGATILFGATEGKQHFEVKEVEIAYSITSSESEEDNTYLSYNKVIGTSLDKELYQAFAILDYALLSAPGAPLKTALTDAGIVKDILGSYDNGIYQPIFSVVAKNANEDQKDAFVEMIEK